MDTYQENLQETAETAIDKQVVSEGGINHAIMTQSMDKLKTDLLDELKTHMKTLPFDRPDPINVPVVSNVVSSRGFIFIVVAGFVCHNHSRFLNKSQGS